MKKHRRTLRFSVTIWYIVLTLVVVVLMMAAFTFISSSVLRRTIREYLIGAVEANVDKIIYVSSKEEAVDSDVDDFFIEYKDGFLQVDDDFLTSMNDVESALYLEDGTLLYGNNPLALKLENKGFEAPGIYRIKHKKTYYYVYDRLIVGDDLEGLWIRGMVPMDTEKRELDNIKRLLFVFVPVIIIISLMAGYFVLEKLLRPMENMKRSIDEIRNDNDLNKRIDITDGSEEIASLAASYNEMMDRLMQSFEAEKRFTSDASHELRTPMSVIMAESEYILEKERSNKEYREAFQVVERQGKRMNALIDDMLVYSRIDRRTEHYPMGDTDLSVLTGSVCEDMSRIKYKGITLSNDIEPDIVIRGNELLLTRLLQNLITNAYKYGKNEGYIRVTLKKGSSDNKAVLMIEDNGIGISEDEKEHIYERFYQADSARTEKDSGIGHGNGLGLSMVKAIADMHNAVIELESEKKSGSTFTLIFL